MDQLPIGQSVTLRWGDLEVDGWIVTDDGTTISCLITNGASVGGSKTGLLKQVGSGIDIAGMRAALARCIQDDPGTIKVYRLLAESEK